MHLRYVREQDRCSKEVLDRRLYANTTWKTFRTKLTRWRPKQRRMMLEIEHLLPATGDEAFGDDELEPDDRDALETKSCDELWTGRRPTLEPA